MRSQPPRRLDLGHRGEQQPIGATDTARQHEYAGCSGRSVRVGSTATAFATMINAGTSAASSCSITPVTSVPASFVYQTTDPATNALTGTPNTPVNIAAGASKSFVIAFTMTAPFAPTVVQLGLRQRAALCPSRPRPTVSLSSSAMRTPSRAARPASPSRRNSAFFGKNLGQEAAAVTTPLGRVPRGRADRPG
jgi:hypothetical protein